MILTKNQAFLYLWSVFLWRLAIIVIRIVLSNSNCNDYKPYGVILNERTTRMTSTISSKGRNKSNIGIGQRLKIHFLSCLRLWVLKLMRPFLFWLILKTLRTRAHSAAEYVRVLEEKNVKICFIRTLSHFEFSR